MMLIVLDKNPILAAQLVPNKLKFKQLLELAQMICSCGYSNIYKKIPQGKEIQGWIKENYTWVKRYAINLLLWCKKNINIKEKTFRDIFNIIHSMPVTYIAIPIKTAIFRYKKDYSGTTYATDTELPIDVAVAEYKKYMEWKNGN